MLEKQKKDFLIKQLKLSSSEYEKNKSVINNFFKTHKKNKYYKFNINDFKDYYDLYKQLKNIFDNNETLKIFWLYSSDSDFDSWIDIQSQYIKNFNWIFLLTSNEEDKKDESFDVFFINEKIPNWNYNFLIEKTKEWLNKYYPDLKELKIEYDLESQNEILSSLEEVGDKFETVLKNLKLKGL